MLREPSAVARGGAHPYVLFPNLTAATILLILLATIFPQVAPVLIGILVINVGVRYLTDRRIGALATAFRQIATLVTTAESLRFFSGRLCPASRRCPSS